MTSEAHPASPPGHWLPSLPATVFVGILAFVVFGFQEPLLNSDGDLARHLRHGEWMLQHHRLITVDPFSYTKGGQPFVGFEYGSQLIYAVVHRIGGLAAVTGLAALLIATTYALLTRFMLRRGVEPFLVALVAAAAAISGMGHWLARPHLITLVAVVVLLGLLSPLRRPRLWPFAPLFIVWANLHGGFVYGLVLIGIFAAGAGCELLVSRDRSHWSTLRFHASAFAVAFVSTLVHPRAIAVYRHISAMFGDTYIINHTAEFQSPNFHDPASKLFLIVILGATAAGFLSRRRASMTTLLVVVCGLYFALVNQRNATLFGLTALPLLAIHLDPEWRRIRFLKRLREGFERGSQGAATWSWVLVSATAIIILSARHGRIAGRQLVGDRFSSSLFPVAAVKEASAARLPGRVFADFGWGGYLLYAWPEKPVFIDGGTDFYGGDLMKQYGIIRADLPGWRELVRRWDLAVMILNPGAPVASDIVVDGRWRYWYCDSTAVVLIRTDLPTAPPPSKPLNAKACASKPGGDTGAS